VPVIAWKGTTHADPRRATRLIGSTTPSLVELHRAVRYFRSVTGVRRPTCELMAKSQIRVLVKRLLTKRFEAAKMAF